MYASYAKVTKQGDNYYTIIAMVGTVKKTIPLDRRQLAALKVAIDEAMTAQAPAGQ